MITTTKAAENTAYQLIGWKQTLNCPCLSSIATLLILTHLIYFLYKDELQLNYYEFCMLNGKAERSVQKECLQICNPVLVVISLNGF
jgi:hypothetical protein